MSSPFLNRRLGGLRFLTNLIRRASNSLTVNGWKVNKTGSGDNVSYSTVPVLYYLSLDDICDRLLEMDLMITLFEGFCISVHLQTIPYFFLRSYFSCIANETRRSGPSSSGIER